VTLYIVLALSIVVNIVLVWYLREVVRRFSLYEVESQNLLNTIDEYLSHIGSVYEMTTFYGDSTIKGLLEHTSDVKKKLLVLRELFILDSLEENREDVDEPEEE
jgi:hypothetical protein